MEFKDYKNVFLNWWVIINEEKMHFTIYSMIILNSFTLYLIANNKKLKYLGSLIES